MKNGWTQGYDFWANETVDWSSFGKYSTFLYAQEAERIISTKKNTQNPFFLYLPFQSVHYPLEVPQYYLDLYPNEKESTGYKFQPDYLKS